jgi:hypothetical protein
MKGGAPRFSVEDGWDDIRILTVAQLTRDSISESKNRARFKSETVQIRKRYHVGRECVPLSNRPLRSEATPGSNYSATLAQTHWSA